MGAATTSPVALDPRALPDEVMRFLRQRHVATLTLLRPDGSPHVSPVGFTWDGTAGLARVITWSGAKKSRLLAASGGGPAAVCQVDGGRWLTLEGHAVVTADPDRCADAVRRYAARYSPPKDRGAERRAIEITVTRVMGRA
jgi:F420H(2)-dependent biliverdin reductase